MSVQIIIGKGGAFPITTTAFQRDLVFWLNDDTQPHYPVPGCSKLSPNDGSLQVAPGGTTPAIQPTASPALPTTITYGCAIAGHESESGAITVTPDGGSPTSGTAAGSRTKTIAISAGGVFATVNIVQADTVVWQNNDGKTHFPVPNCTGLLAKPQGVTNPMQPCVASWAGGLPQSIGYGCAIPGHESENGIINVYNNFVAVTPPVDLTSANPAPIATGGGSPYQMTDDPRYPYLTLQETAPAGSSTGVSIAASSPPAGVSSVDYQLNVTDVSGITINQSIQIKLS